MDNKTRASKERRRFRRWPINGPARLRRTGSRQDLPAYCRDLSAGGVLVEVAADAERHLTRDELFDLCLLSRGGMATLNARTRLRRMDRIAGGRLQLGLEIIEMLS